MKADLARQIERNLCATARTPKIHRTELMRHVHQPTLVRVDYSVEPSVATREGILMSLSNALHDYDIRRDPYVIDLIKQQQEGYDVSQRISKVCVSGKTYCRDQLKALVPKAEATAEELGESPADW
jgi:hypothetical protein